MIKTLKTLALSALCVACATSCGSRTEEITYLPVKMEKNGSWGMVGPDGKMLFEDEFKNEPSPVLNGVFTVREGDGLSVYLADEKPRVIGDLEDLKYAGGMSEGVIPVVRKGERICYYNKDGKLKFTLDPVNGMEITSVSGIFHDGRAIICNEEGKYGVIDSDGKVIVEPKYHYIAEYRDGLAIAKHDNSDDEEDLEYEFINRSGEVKAKITGYNLYSTFYSGYILAKKKDNYGLINKDGEFNKLSGKVKGVDMWNDKYVVFQGEDGHGVMTHDGEIVIRPKYRSVTILNNGKFLAYSNNKKFYLVNKNDEREMEFEDVKTLVSFGEVIDFQYGLKCKFGLIGGDDDHELYFYNEKGETLNKNEYYSIGADLWRLTETVASDYFNVQGAADKFVEPLTANGYDGKELNKPIYKYLTGAAEDNKYVRTVDLTGKTGLKYSISGFALSSEYAVKSEPVYTTNTFYGYSYQSFSHYSYSWDTSAKVDAIVVYLNISTDGFYSQTKDAIVDAMKAKGYKVSASTKAYAILRNGNVYAILLPTSGSENAGVQMNMYTENYWNDVKQNLINTAESRFNDINNDSDTEEVEVVEEVEAYPYEEEVVEAVAEDWEY